MINPLYFHAGPKIRAFLSKNPTLLLVSAEGKTSEQSITLNVWNSDKTEHFFELTLSRRDQAELFTELIGWVHRRRTGT